MAALDPKADMLILFFFLILLLRLVTLLVTQIRHPNHQLTIILSLGRRWESRVGTVHRRHTLFATTVHRGVYCFVE